MHETECTGVQGLSRTYRKAIFNELAVFGGGGAAQYLVAAVAYIVEQRMPDMLHVYANLMGAPRLKHAFHHGNIAKRLNYRIMRYGVFARGVTVGQNCHLQAVLGVTPDVPLDAPFAWFGDAPYHSHIFAFGGLVEELTPEMRLGVGCLGHNQQP